jgi:hypothetical protein
MRNNGARWRILLAAVGVAAWLLTLGGTARGGEGDAALAAFTGTYRLEDAAAVGKAIEQAIEQAIAPMNVITRTVARGRLRETNSPYQVVVFDIRDGAIRFTRDGGNPVLSDAVGTPVPWKREDGKLYEVTQAADGTTLRQCFRAEDGSRTNLFSLSEDAGRLTVAVTVTSPKLPKPLTYSMTLARAATP